MKNLFFNNGDTNLHKYNTCDIFSSLLIPIKSIFLGGARYIFRLDYVVKPGQVTIM